MDFAALRAEIDDDPDGRGYAGKPEWQVAALLNAPSVPAKRKVSTSDARGYLLKSGAWGGICLLAENSTAPDALRSAAIIARDTMLHTSQMDTDEPQTLAMVGDLLASLVAAGVMTEDHRGALLAMADGLQSRAEALGLGGVSANDVAAALSLEG